MTGWPGNTSGRTGRTIGCLGNTSGRTGRTIGWLGNTSGRTGVTIGWLGNTSGRTGSVQNDWMAGTIRQVGQGLCRMTGWLGQHVR